ncbi:ABC transporter permease [Shinella sp. M27]|uniref:ABC transporter permease n=1 Tax=Shinella sp. M27 TaxID=3368614 RepID=UPI003BA1B5A1
MLDGFGTSRWLTLLKWTGAIALAVFMSGPSLIVVPMSFSASDFLQFPPTELSLRWYQHFFSSLTWMDASRASLVVGVLTTALSVPIGIAAAYGVMSLSARMRIMVSALIVLPAIIPAILIAIGLFFVLARIGMVGSLSGLVLGHVALAIPVVFVVMSAAFSQFDFTQQKAARSLGATGWQAWRKVVLPQVSGSIAAASLLAFVTSLDEVVVAMFVASGEYTTLPKVMFTLLRDQIDPTIAVVSTLLLLIATLAVLVVLKKGKPVI